MDNSKIVTARKDHECEMCIEGIKKGERYELQKHRIPRFDSFDPYIEFLTFRTCHRCYMSQFDDPCNNECDCIPVRNMDDHGVPTGDLVCINCGKTKPAIQ